MHTVGQTPIWSYLDDSDILTKVDNRAVRKSGGHQVRSYLDLAKKISTLQFKNPEFVLFFRGQTADWPNRLGHSTLKPSLFRSRIGSRDPASEQLLRSRFDRLSLAEQLLVERYGQEDRKSDLQIRRHRLLRWSIIQHYEICVTPLLDVTHSLRIAASFASIGDEDTAILYVLAIPNISGAITASAEAGLQIVRLSSVCPPTAVRPHIQEGYLLGEYPAMTDFRQKQNYASSEIDFGRRLLAKFRFRPSDLWSSPAFPRVSPEALYPDAHDPLIDVKSSIQKLLGPEP